MSYAPSRDGRESENTVRNPVRESSMEDEKNLAPLAEERQVPTGLENPFWKPDR